MNKIELNLVIAEYVNAALDGDEKQRRIIEIRRLLDILEKE